MRPGRWRYLRTAKVMLQFPTYARLVWGLARDARTPIGLKLLLGAAITYVVTPLDLIPDVVPILGHADDLTVLLLVLDVFISNAPAAVRDEHLARARTGQAVLDEDLAQLRSLLGGTVRPDSRRAPAAARAVRRARRLRRGQAPDRRVARREPRGPRRRRRSLGDEGHPQA